MPLTLKTKMIGTVVLLAGLAVVLAAIGIASMAEIHRKTVVVDDSSTRLELAYAAQVDLLTWLRATETLLSVGAASDVLKQARSDGDAAYKRLVAGTTHLAGVVVSAQSKADIAQVETAVSQYKVIADRAYEAFDQGKTDELMKLMKSVTSTDDEVIGNLSKIIARNNGYQQEALVVVNNTYSSDTFMLYLISTIGIVLFVGFGLWVIVFGIAKPLEAMTDAMSRVANADLTIQVPSLGRRDEIGRLASALETFKANGVEKNRLELEQERQKQAAEADKRRMMNQLADNFESSVRAVVNGVSSVAACLQTDAQGLSAIADQTNRQACAVAAAAEQASDNVHTVAAATDELSSSVSEISRQIGESSRIAGVAVDEANKTNVTVAGLSDAAQKIGEVVGLINDIASQTNLLALNATIEAARAGEAGKGFAVVASEVKNLANQTAKATEDIQAQVSQMQTVTGTAVDAIHAITGTIRHMSEITTTIAVAVEQQGSATHEIAQSIQKAFQGTQDVSRNIGGVTQAAGETGQMAGSVLGAANDMSKVVERLRNEVDSFVKRVRNG